MQIDDDVVFRYFELLSSRTPDEVAALREEKAAGATPWRSRRSSRARWSSAFTTRGRPSARPASLPAFTERTTCRTTCRASELAPAGGVAELAWALKQANLAESTSAARRLVEQGGVEIDGQRATDPKMRLLPGTTYLVRVGSKSRRFARIVIAAG